MSLQPLGVVPLPRGHLSRLEKALGDPMAPPNIPPSQRTPAPEVETEENSSAPDSSSEPSAQETAGQEETDSGSGPRILPRASVENGLGGYDLDNGEGYDHFSRHIRLEGGVELPIDELFFGQINLFGTFGHARRDLGLGAISSFDHQSVGLNGRFGLSLLDDYLRFTAGINVAASHVNAPESEDGSTSGALHNRNAQLYPMDDLGILFGGEIGISILRGVINFFGRFGGIFGLNPNPELVDESATSPDFPLNISYLTLGASLEVMTIIRMLSGEWD